MSNQLLTDSGTTPNTVERRYDSKEDRLFLVYYALPPGLNANKWGVSPSSLPVNIKTAINKPVIIYRKNPNNSFHTKQAGNFVHPTPEEAAAELGKPLTEPEYYQWQEKYAVGRVRSVDKRDRGYAFTLEITDRDSKEILKTDKYRNGIPGWTSPQILTYPRIYPQEEATGIHDHWVVSHVILTDSPAYGLQRSALQAKCLGQEQECLIKTKNASNESIGFCVKQATIDLIDSRSSLESQNSTLLHNTMSQTETQPNPNEVVVTKTLSEQNQKQEGEQQAPPAGSGIGVEGDANERERPQSEAESSQPEESQEAPIAKTLDEANLLIRKLTDQSKAKDEMLKTQAKEWKNVNKRLELLETERQRYLIKSVIPKDLFKSEQAHDNEVTRVINNSLDKDLNFLKEHYDLLRKARISESQTASNALAPKAKSASVNIATEYQAQNASQDNLSSLVDRTVNLPKKMFGGIR